MVKLGQIINTRGLKGEVKIESCTSFGSLRYKEGNEVVLDNGSNKLILHPFKYSSYKGYDYVYFKEISNIDEANKLKGYEVYIDEKYLHQLKDSFYFFELMNMDCYDLDNNYLGKVTEVFDNPSNVVLRIKNKEEFLVPFVKQFIKNVDKNNKKIIIDMMEELL